jgi:4-diphosphocytidyl-2-C-methyl-D-erythritol kinase
MAGCDMAGCDMPRGEPVRELARAKVNLTLEVLGLRADGYHELASLVVFANVGDVVTLAPDALGIAGHASIGGPARVTVSGPFAGFLETALAGPNLVVTALDRLRAACPDLRLGHVFLEKNLPIAAGLGGGSADAAAVLRAVRRLNPDLAAGVPWDAIAASLGSDVPVCLDQRTTWMTGKGEVLAHVEGVPELHVILVNAQSPVPADKTAQVFRTLAASALAPDRVPIVRPAFNGDVGADTTRTAEFLLAFMTERGNDLEMATRQVLPSVDQVLAALHQPRFQRPSTGGQLEPDSAEPDSAEPDNANPRRHAASTTKWAALPLATQTFAAPTFAGMSGAGPTCFAVYPSQATAERAAAWLQQHQPTWWVMPTRLG